MYIIPILRFLNLRRPHEAVTGDTLFLYLFIWLCQVLVAKHGIFRCGMWTLSCGMWDLVPWPRIEPRPCTLGTQSPSHRTTKEVHRRNTIIPILLKRKVKLRGLLIFSQYHTACSRDRPLSQAFNSDPLIIPTHWVWSRQKNRIHQKKKKMFFEALENKTSGIWFHLEMRYSSIKGHSRLTGADPSMRLPLVPSLTLFSTAFHTRPSKCFTIWNNFSER